MNTQTKKHGFTLIEMLAVIVILGILLALVIGVTDYVRTEAKRKQTRATMDIVMTAIQVYYDNEGDWPMLQEENSSTWRYLGEDENIWVDSSGNEQTYKTGLLMYSLSQVPKCKEMISKLSKSTWGRDGEFEVTFKTNNETKTVPELIDAFEAKILYYKKGGLGGAPLLISRGPDGKINSTATHKDNEDNIRSDD